MPISDDWQNKILHCSLNINEDLKIYLSDSFFEKKPVNNTVFLHVVFETEDELRKVYHALSLGGSVNMPIGSTFWGSVYGDIVDKFGTGWQLEFILPN